MSIVQNSTVLHCTALHWTALHSIALCWAVKLVSVSVIDDK